MTPTQSDEELKPCPFCGSPAERIDNGYFKFFIRCSSKTCNVLVNASSDMSSEECVKDWNTRHAEQELEAVKREYWMAARRAKDGTTIGMDYTEGHGPAFSTLETYEQFKQAQGAGRE